jgi:hypothetical protein
VRFSEHVPSKQWAALKYRGEKMAEVWFKPEGEPYGLAFRIPKESFQISGMAECLTMENLLRALAVVPEEIESWRHGDVAYAGNVHVEYALPPPPLSVPHLDIHVRLKPPPEAVAREEGGEFEISAAKRQDFETGWKAILGLEATMGAMRNNMEGLLAEMESLWKRPLTTEDKTYAPRADVAQWSKSKNRIHNAVPKIKDIIHRSVRAMGSPERKRLEEVYNDHLQPHIPFPQIDDVLKQFEELQKDRQVLSAHVKSVYQECRGIAAEFQGALRTLHSNASQARNKKGASGSKGRFN